MDTITNLQLNQRYLYLLELPMPSETPFDLKFTSREVTAWGGLALL